MTKAELYEGITRWTHASIKDYIKSKLTGVVVRSEGEEDHNPVGQITVEIRIDGPTLIREGTIGEYQGMCEVNLLITAQRNEKYVHLFQDTVGKCMTILDNCIPVNKIGKETDDQSPVGVLQLLPDEVIDVNNFGQIDTTIRTQQGAIEAHYRIKLEI